MAHKNFIMANLEEWVKARKLVVGFVPLTKPQHLVTFEGTHRNMITAAASPVPKAGSAAGANSSASATVVAVPGAGASASGSASGSGTGTAASASTGISRFGATVL